MQGLLLINKPKDITSFKAVAAVRKKANTKKVGHTGTLDPLATGVLPVLVGRATALCDYLLTADKEYIASVKAGMSTDTLDITGTVLSEATPCFNTEKLEKALKIFLCLR
jgi:tRNA pseudouridine55 synthase